MIKQNSLYPQLLNPLGASTIAAVNPLSMFPDGIPGYVSPANPYDNSPFYPENRAIEPSISAADTREDFPHIRRQMDLLHNTSTENNTSRTSQKSNISPSEQPLITKKLPAININPKPSLVTSPKHKTENTPSFAPEQNPNSDLNLKSTPSDRQLEIIPPSLPEYNHSVEKLSPNPDTPDTPSFAPEHNTNPDLNLKSTPSDRQPENVPPSLPEHNHSVEKLSPNPDTPDAPSFAPEHNPDPNINLKSTQSDRQSENVPPSLPEQNHSLVETSGSIPPEVTPIQPSSVDLLSPKKDIPDAPSFAPEHNPDPNINLKSTQSDRQLEIIPPSLPEQNHSVVETSLSTPSEVTPIQPSSVDLLSPNPDTPDAPSFAPKPNPDTNINLKSTQSDRPPENVPPSLPEQNHSVVETSLSTPPEVTPIQPSSVDLLSPKKDIPDIPSFAAEHNPNSDLNLKSTQSDRPPENVPPSLPEHNHSLVETSGSIPPEVTPIQPSSVDLLSPKKDIPSFAAEDLSNTQIDLESTPSDRATSEIDRSETLKPAEIQQPNIADLQPKIFRESPSVKLQKQTIKVEASLADTIQSQIEPANVFPETKTTPLSDAVTSDRLSRQPATEIEVKQNMLQDLRSPVQASPAIVPADSDSLDLSAPAIAKNSPTPEADSIEPAPSTNFTSESPPQIPTIQAKPTPSEIPQSWTSIADLIGEQNISTPSPSTASQPVSLPETTVRAKLHNQARYDPVPLAFRDRSLETASSPQLQSLPDDNPVETEAAAEIEDDTDRLEVLAQEIYFLLKQRLEIERERQGGYYSNRLF